MLDALGRFCLKSFMILALAACLCLLGTLALLELPFDAFPDATPVIVQVNVASPGWAPDDLAHGIISSNRS